MEVGAQLADLLLQAHHLEDQFSTANPSTGAHDRTASFHQGTAAAAVSVLTGPV